MHQLRTVEKWQKNQILWDKLSQSPKLNCTYCCIPSPHGLGCVDSQPLQLWCDIVHPVIPVSLIYTCTQRGGKYSNSIRIDCSRIDSVFVPVFGWCLCACLYVQFIQLLEKTSVHVPYKLVALFAVMMTVTKALTWKCVCFFSFKTEQFELRGKLKPGAKNQDFWKTVIRFSKFQISFQLNSNE